MIRVRSGFSFRDAAGSLDEVILRLREAGLVGGAAGNVMPLTDRASTFGWVKWDRAVRAHGYQPAFGVELAVSPDPTEKKPVFDYWAFIATESIGPVNRLVELATTQFRYRPLLRVDQALEAEGVIRVAGHRTNPRWLGEADRETTSFALSPATSVGQFRAASNAGFGWLASSDNRYPAKGDRGFYEVLCGRNAETQSYPQHILSENEWRAAVEAVASEAEQDAALGAARKALSGCTAALERAELVHPPRPASLRDMCVEGAQALGVDLDNPTYSQRLEKELALIHEKQFEDYFYLVAELCQWARARMVVGPARGSSCGSLVCYLLRITTVDPIPYGLIFERFIDVNRADLPDIDIDFSDQQRYLVFEHAKELYGADRVARLGTVAMFRPRSALQEVGAALRLPRWKCDAVAESLIERSSGDSRALNTLEDTAKAMPAGRKLLEDHPEAAVAFRFEGHPRHYSQHAAGMVVAERPITDFVAIDHRTGATMCDKEDAEALNLLKIDVLGLKQLSVFEDALELAGLPRDTLEKAPLDDPAAFEVLNKEQWAGIFQFNGMALQSIAKQFRIDRFADVVSVTALGRPGPLASGSAHEWVHRKNGRHPVSYPHPVFEPYLKDTLGICIYQEQVMEIGRNVGGLSWGDVSKLRKAMSKSLGKEYFDQFGDPWKEGAIEKGVEPEAANKVWDDLCAYGAMGFNKSHAVAYGLISYWCCWLKAHHPFEFAAATLSHEDKIERQIQVLREMVKEGYSYKPFDKRHSKDKWSVGWEGDRKVLVGPLSAVKGLGPKMVSQIMSARARGEPINGRAAKLMDNPVTELDSLWPIRDAFQRVLPDPRERNIFTPPTPVVDVQPGEDREVLLFCVLSKINPRDENEVVMVARRGYEINDGRTTSLNLQLTDDTDTVFGKINRYKFEALGKPIVERGRPGKCLYAIKGRVRGDIDFRMVHIDAVRFIGEVDR